MTDDHWKRYEHIQDCPQCGSNNTYAWAPEKGAVGIYCDDCDWTIDPYS